MGWLNTLFAVQVLLQFGEALQWDPARREVPDFIVKNSPLVYLYSEERYYPGSIREYLEHFTLTVEGVNYSCPLTPSNLTKSAQLARNKSGNPNAAVYLTSIEQWDPEPGPEWLTKYEKNRPNLWTGKIEDALATLIVVDKPEQGVIDAFWHYFYPFNLGPFVMGHGPFGNHIGDWEHSLVRFDRETSQPKLVWISAHGGGSAFHWKSVSEVDNFGNERPIIYSARGTHAQYTSPGRHPHDTPWHMLSDYTDRGDQWDPAKNFLAYTFDGDVIHPANGTITGREEDFGDWLLYDGFWGNKQLEKTDARQQWSPFEWRLIDGPTGPLFKNLMRKSPCERFKWWNILHTCRVRNGITAGEGIESDVPGCQIIVDKFPSLLRPIVGLLMKSGWLCFWLDRLFA